MSTVVFPWPLKDLSPNARVHWAALSRAKKKYRHACWLLARKAGLTAQTLAGAERADVHLLFYPPDRRVRDQDNLVASMKSGLDGLADALKVNDGMFRVTFDISDDIGGMVRVTVTPTESKA